MSIFKPDPHRNYANVLYVWSLSHLRFEISIHWRHHLNFKHIRRSCIDSIPIPLFISEPFPSTLYIASLSKLPVQVSITSGRISDYKYQLKADWLAVGLMAGSLVGMGAMRLLGRGGRKESGARGGRMDTGGRWEYSWILCEVIALCIRAIALRS
jgi:hypothetical protein